MADSALSIDPLERYGAIERAYCEERWMAVIHDGQNLLAELAGSVEVPPEGLKERLQLLVAHAYLYGVGDRDSAEDFYQAVLRSGAEASLRQIAEQGLQQCALPVSPPESQEEPLEPEEQQSPSGLVSPAAADPSDWQEVAAGGTPADSASPSESDSLLTPQERSAPPQPAQDSWGAAAPQTSSGQVGALGWLTAEVTAAPRQSGTLPVMPWLETSAAAAAAPVMPFQPEQAIEQEDLAAGDELLDSATGSRPLQEAETWTALDASPEPASFAGDGGPELSPETAASLLATAAAVAAAFQSELTAPPPESAAVAAAADGAPQVPVEVEDSLQASSAGLDETAAPALSPVSSPVEERLVADVVEEPELIELNLADGLRREELLLEAGAAESEADPNRGIPLPLEPGPPAGMDRRRTEPLPDEPEDSPAEQEPDLAPAEVVAPVSVSPRPRSAAGRGPFSGPPEPVAEEDPELLMGLLKVEMG